MFNRPSRGNVRRRITARFAVLSAVLLAAGTAIIPANAQQATMAVFAPSSESVALSIPGGGSDNVDLSGSISMIVVRISTDIHATFVRDFFDLLNPDGTTVSPQTPNADFLPQFGTPPAPVSPGDFLRIREDAFAFSNIAIVAQGYVNGNPPNLTMFVSVGVGTASDLAAGQRFINENGITTTTPAATNIGYAGPPSCDNTADLFVDDNDVMCELVCPSDEVENTDATMCMDPLTDAACNTMMPGSEANADRNECVFTADSCGDAMLGSTVNTAADGCTFTDASCDASVEGPGPGANAAADGCAFTNEQCGMIIVGSETTGADCVCPDGEERQTGDDGTDYCVAFDAAASDLYTAETCERAGWDSSYEVDSSVPEIVAEVCEIPYEIAAASSGTSAAGGLALLQVNAGDTGDSCAIRRISGDTTTLCNDPGLFAEDRFPTMPPTFDASAGHRLTVDASTGEILVLFDGNTVDRLPDPTTSTDTGGGSGDGAAAAPAAKKSGQHALGVGAGLGVLVYLYAWHYYDGDIGGLFNFSPDYGYAVTEGGYSYRYGGRLDFRNEDLHLYWKAGHANSNGDFGDFRYESGGEYSADFWTASFSEVIRSEESDYDFSLSADYRGGIWRLSPTYRLRHFRYAEKESETANSLNLEGVLRYNRWTISPSAGFNWESADEFGDNAKFGLSAVRRF